MEETNPEASETIFNAFNKGEYQVVTDEYEKYIKAIESLGNEDETEAIKKQAQMVNLLVEYFKDGSKDPKKVYKGLQDIDNGDNSDDTSEINYLLEYNCGVFAYLSQIYDNAFTHFYKILKHSDEAELFLVIKSAFILLQILMDNMQIEASKIMIDKLEDLLPLLEKVTNLKKAFRSDISLDKPGDSNSKGAKLKGLRLEYFSIS